LRPPLRTNYLQTSKPQPQYSMLLNMCVCVCVFGECVFIFDPLKEK
jgi:hypothetical protein